MTHSYPTRRSSDLRVQPNLPSRRRGGGDDQPSARLAARASSRSHRPLCWAMSCWAPKTIARSTAGLSAIRSEEHTSELQSLMRISYAVFCLKKKNHLLVMTKLDRYTTQANN